MGCYGPVPTTTPVGWSSLHANFNIGRELPEISADFRRICAGYTHVYVQATDALLRNEVANVWCMSRLASGMSASTGCTGLFWGYPVGGQNAGTAYRISWLDGKMWSNLNQWNMRSGKRRSSAKLAA